MHCSRALCCHSGSSYCYKFFLSHRSVVFVYGHACFLLQTHLTLSCDSHPAQDSVYHSICSPRTLHVPRARSSSIRRACSRRARVASVCCGVHCANTSIFSLRKHKCWSSSRLRFQPLPDLLRLQQGAQFSPCRAHRVHLHLWWSTLRRHHNVCCTAPVLMYIALTGTREPSFLTAS